MSDRIEFKYYGKHIVRGKINVESGLTIGSTDDDFSIGNVSTFAIKNPITKEPIIPGSSLKGKIRSLLEWNYDLVEMTENKDRSDSTKAVLSGKAIYSINEEMLKKRKMETVYFDKSNKDDTKYFTPIAVLFGIPNEVKDSPGPTRTIFRDAEISALTREMLDNNEIESYFEVKTENSIDRITSNANPRKIERVVPNTVFDFEISIDNYSSEDYKFLKYILEGMRLLEESFLGGGGSRGSGKIRFNKLVIEKVPKEYFSGNSDLKQKIAENDSIDALYDFIKKQEDKLSFKNNGE